MKLRVYSSTFAEFQTKINSNKLYNELAMSYPAVVGHAAGKQEANSWKASLPRLEAAMRLAALPLDVQVILEQRMPYYAKRIDATLLGYDQHGNPNVVIVELKAWTEAKADAEESGNVLVSLGGGLVPRPHPSQQVRGYHDHLLDFFRCFHSANPLALSSCAYCHNYGVDGADDDGLFHAQFDKIRAQSPTFAQDHVQDFGEFLQQRLLGGKGHNIQILMDDAGIGPSQSLIDHAKDVIQQQVVFRLMDDQLTANNSILAAFKNASKKKQKRVLLVRGGPGTGKSVIALNTVGEALKQGLDVSLVTGSAAFTYGIRKVLGNRLSGLVRFTDFFWSASENSKDVIIVDEGHRIRDRSTPRVPKAQRPVVSQAEELIRAARVTVIFADENQIISPDEVGGARVFRQACDKLGVHLEEFTLKSQFRCDGSDAYLLWLDDLLDLIPEPQGFQLKVPEAFDIKLVESPHTLLEEVTAKNNQYPNSARLVAGWCWPWSDPTPDGLVNDVVIGDFQLPWESKNGKKPPKGIPEAKYWAVDPAGAGQAGTVYSMQGFEMKHMGIIIGPDLVVRDGKWVAQPDANYSNGLRKKDPAVALPYIKRIYRTLLSRATHSCSVYCIDEETRKFIATKLLS